MMKILRTRPINLGHFYQNFLVKMPQIFSGSLSFGQLTLDMRVFKWSMGSPDCKDIEIAMVEVYFQGTWFNPLFGKNAPNSSAWFSGFSSFGQLTLDMGVFIRSMGSPDCKDKAPDSTLFWGVLRGLGAWITFKKAEMDKTLWNGLSISETDLLNQKWLDFAI